MDSLLSGFKDFLDSRVKNLLFMNFLLSWLIVNYKISMVVLFKSMSIDEKIEFINNLEFEWSTWIVLPFGLTLFYIYALPFINLGIVKMYDKYIHNFIKEHEHNKRLKSFHHKRKEEEAKHNAITFVERDLELKKQREENSEREKAVQLAERENSEREKSRKLLEEENKAKEKELMLLEQKASLTISEKDKYENKLDELRKQTSQVYDLVENSITKGTKITREELESIPLSVGDLKYSKCIQDDVIKTMGLLKPIQGTFRLGDAVKNLSKNSSIKRDK